MLTLGEAGWKVSKSSGRSLKLFCKLKKFPKIQSLKYRVTTEEAVKYLHKKIKSGKRCFAKMLLFQQEARGWKRKQKQRFFQAVKSDTKYLGNLLRVSYARQWKLRGQLMQLIDKVPQLSGDSRNFYIQGQELASFAWGVFGCAFYTNAAVFTFKVCFYFGNLVWKMKEITGLGYISWRGGC